MPSHTLYIIGIDRPVIDGHIGAIISGCKTLVLSERFRVQLTAFTGAYNHLNLVPITPLKQALEEIEISLQSGNVAVLATGDPLFFGIGRRLIEKFEDSDVQVLPAVSSMQHAFARFKISWEDAGFLSLHGRTDTTLIPAVAGNGKTGLLTDNSNTPATIARELLKFFEPYDSRLFTVHIGENLGLANEKLTTGSLEDIACLEFSSLCCMIILRDKFSSAAATRFGLQEAEIVHSRGLITKNEVRAAAIHALRLEPGSVLWDVGAGSGSVGLEAARIHRDILVYAVEKNKEQLANIHANKKKFDVLNLKVIPGEAPEALIDLPLPQRIFIGGSGGRLESIIPACVDALAPEGIVVITGVLEKTCRKAPEMLHQLGLQVETKRIEVFRRAYPDEDEVALNPITVTVGIKKRNSDSGERDE